MPSVSNLQGGDTDTGCVWVGWEGGGLWEGEARAWRGGAGGRATWEHG
jgi:hypothetical protein